mmetsp:Transcript_12458/g.34980  ORF Transcript_12458/g.34980 Transcript_12458/m.34980 type:complete len:180 (-) Transcript_12458:748-1287(-)
MGRYECYDGWWSHNARVLGSVMDLVEFGCVLALLIITAVYLTDFQNGVCYLDGYSGYVDLTVCYSVFWATALAGIVGFAIAFAQLCVCCFSSMVLIFEVVGDIALAMWWLAMAIYLNHAGTEANQLGFPYGGQRMAALILAWVIAVAHILSSVLSFGRFSSLCCCSPPRVEVPPAKPAA